MSKTISKVKEKNLNDGLDMYLVWAWLESKPLGDKTMTYLIRRMNKKGHWMTIDSLDYIPRQWFGWDNYLKWNHGPGKYNIGYVEKGLAGMRQVGTFNVGYEHEFIRWVHEKPTLEFLKQNGIYGDLIIAKLSNSEYIYEIRDNELKNQQVREQLDQGLQGFQSGWVIIRVHGLPR